MNVLTFCGILPLIAAMAAQASFENFEETAPETLPAGWIGTQTALEDNITIYHTARGKRTEFKRVKLKVTPGTWHRLRVEFSGSRFTVALDGAKALEASDSTFTEPVRSVFGTKRIA